ncbi:MAG: lysophospholipid acyltransferase family protein [bacterium]
MNSRTKKIIKSSFTYVILGLSGIIILPIALVISYISGENRQDSRLYFFLTSIFSRLCIYSTFISYSIKGTDHLPLYPDNPSIILINHSSIMDIPLVEIILKSYPRIWISNDYSRCPLIGPLLKRMHIIINRRKPLEALRKAIALTKNKKRHILIFPEGTRHNDGKIHNFYAGFALLAERLQRPIIPIAIHGLNKICPKKQYLIDSSACTVKISIGKPIHYDPTTPRKDFIDKVQHWFVEEINALKG